MDRKVEKREASFPAQPKVTRVAAYGRVSTGKDAMLHSLSAQISYYSSLIQNHPGWSYCGVYADEALTGTRDDRENFQRLLKDCRDGKIDMVITKSISRFARNTVTLLETVRELKSLGIDVYFEEQNIHTMSSDGELMLTILASYAQEESRSASENQKWRIRKSYEKGEVLQWRHLFGYNITKDKIEINPEQADAVREIFQRAINGESFSTIAKDLNKRGILTIFGNKWTACRITQILTNEKYIGDALLQKKYVNNHIEKKLLINKGELPMYYAEGTHEAIIDKETFAKAQEIVRYWKEQFSGRNTPKHYPFTSRIKCGLCGCNFKRVTCNGKVYWNCRTFQEKGKAGCPSKQIPESILEEVCTAVLDLDSFDGEVFKEQIARIEVPGANRLTFVFKDGRREERTWKDRSRADSWIPEMKEKARQRTLENQRRKKQWEQQPVRSR